MPRSGPQCRYGKGDHAVKYLVTVNEYTVYSVDADSPESAEDFVFDVARCCDVDDNGKPTHEYVWFGGEITGVEIKEYEGSITP